MAQTAWVTMTRATAGRQSSKTARTRVGAGVKEQNEMTIGRTDDPENPFGATAIKAAFVFGAGSRTPSGPAVMVPRQQAGHMIAIDPPVRILTFPLAPEGPSTHAPRRRGIVFRPVRHPVSGLGKLVASAFSEFVRHELSQPAAWDGRPILRSRRLLATLQALTEASNGHL